MCVHWGTGWAIKSPHGPNRLSTVLKFKCVLCDLSIKIRQFFLEILPIEVGLESSHLVY